MTTFTTSENTTEHLSPQMLTLPRNVNRVLLLHPPIVDLRIPWVRYIQPLGLLRLSTFFRSVGAEVKLIDAVAPMRSKSLRRVLARTITIDEQPIGIWRFGQSPFALRSALQTLLRENWVPDIIYVEGPTTFWWPGIAEMIQLARSVFPQIPIVLFGAYASITPNHAKNHTYADTIGVLPWAQLGRLTPDLDHYEEKPACVYLSLNEGTREPGEIVDELRALYTDYRVRSFAFLDHGITTHRLNEYCAILEAIIAAKLRVGFAALGNIPLADLAQHPELAGLMRRAGYTQICFADDRSSLPQTTTDPMLIEQARLCAQACYQAGFRMRTDAVTASLCLGRVGESLEERSRTATLLAHHIGSVILWPYQPHPDELASVALEDQNGKLFPFREHNCISLDAYMGILGLASILNAKYRTKTIDFLGEGMIARLFRDSLARQAWDPPEDVKGTLKLPVVPK